MRSRKLTGGVRCSARLRAQSCSAGRVPPQASPGTLPARPPCQPSLGRRTSKKFKPDKGRLGKTPLPRAARTSPAAAPQGLPETRSRSEPRDCPSTGAAANGAEASSWSPERGAERGTPSPLLPLDPSVFLDDDSTQPLPVTRFFGNMELMQDLPRATPSCPSLSRRELRKLHFRAKEDEDEDAAETEVPTWRCGPPGPTLHTRLRRPPLTPSPAPPDP